jgi:hypothetical protein
MACNKKWRSVFMELRALHGNVQNMRMGKYEGTVTNMVLWYLSAIVLELGSRQYWGCVGKVRASHLSSVVLSL